MKVICDTNVFIQLFNGDEETAREIEQIGSENVLLPAVALMELVIGMQNKQELQQLEKRIRGYHILHLNAPASQKAVELVRQFRLSQGLKIPDALLGAMAITYGITFFTYNLKDFRFIPGIQLYQPTTTS